MRRAWVRQEFQGGEKDSHAKINGEASLAQSAAGAVAFTSSPGVQGPHTPCPTLLASQACAPDLTVGISHRMSPRKESAQHLIPEADGSV